MAFTLVNHVSAASMDGYTATSAAVNMTGADFFIIRAVQSNVAAGGVPTDSGGNGWLSGAGQFETGWSVPFSPDGSGNPFYTIRMRMWYVVNPITSAAQTFQIQRLEIQEAPYFDVFAFKGVSQHTLLGVPWPFDDSGDPNSFISNYTTSGPAVKTGQIPSALTPSQNGCLVFNALGNFRNTFALDTIHIDSGSVISQAPVAGGAFGGGLNYSIQTTATPVQPIWTWGDTDFAIAATVIFRSDGIAPPPPSGSGIQTYNRIMG